MFNTHSQTQPVSNRSILFRHELAAAFKAHRYRVPGAPASLSVLLDVLQSGFPGAQRERFEVREAVKESVALRALADMRAAVFQAPGRDAEMHALWSESVATGAFASRVAQLKQASIVAAGCGGLLHRAGEALALRMLARAELQRRVRLDGPSRQEWCLTHGNELIERLVREWGLATEVGTCVLGWNRFGEFAEVSRDSAAIYFGRLLALELLHPDFCVPGAVEGAAAGLGLSSAAVEQLRQEGGWIRKLLGKSE